MQSTAYALLPTENRHDGKDFEYWGADAAFFIKTFPNFNVTASFPHRRADPDHLALGDPNFSGLPARLQAVHHGGAVRRLGAGSGPGPAEPLSYQCVAVYFCRERVGGVADYSQNFCALYLILVGVLSGGYGPRAQRHCQTSHRPE